MDAFKTRLNREALGVMRDRLAVQSAAFSAPAFEEALPADYDALELRNRVSAVATALRAALPDAPQAAIALLLSALEEDRAAAPVPTWCVWPITEYVARHALHDPVLGLSALRRMTRFFTSEFGIRPFLLHHPETTLDTMTGWTRDRDPHIRRLASEGSRPLLPWASRIGWLLENPRATAPILDALRNDGADTVRRSVANHLNDISRIDPKAAIATARDWRRLGVREDMLSHALRGLIKRCDPAAFDLLGYRSGAVELAAAAVEAARVRLGEAIRFTVDIRNPTRETQRVMVDYALSFPGRNGADRRLVFKGGKRSIPAGRRATVTRAHCLKNTTVRTYPPGAYTLEILVNGDIAGTMAVDVAPAAS